MCSASAFDTTSTIQTPRLKLRPVTLADAPAIAAYASDLDIARMTSRIPHPFGLNEAVSFVEKVGAHDSVDEAVFAICTNNGELAGVLGFHHAHGLDFPEMGYWLGKPWWGKGFATEAVNAALIWAKDCWGKKALRAAHFADNPASGSVLVKSDFLYTGEVVSTHSVARGESVDMRMMVWLA